MKIKEYKIAKYKACLDEMLVDEEIKEEIIKLINFYNEYGRLNIDGNSLYGKYINDKDLNYANPVKEFLEIKIDGSIIICNYTDWCNRRVVNIIQNCLKGAHNKIYKKTTDESRAYNNRNEYNIEEIEKIYDEQNNIVYDCKLEKNSDFDTYYAKENSIIYNGKTCFENCFNLEKNWYISNGSIIKYKLEKAFLDENDGIYESYSVCPHELKIDNERKYFFVDLDKELFKQFMIGNITIYDLLDKNKEVNKKLVKENK